MLDLLSSHFLCTYWGETVQWPDLFWDPAKTGNVTLRALGYLLPPSQTGACTCNLVGTLVSWRSCLRLTSSSVCWPVPVMLIACFFQTGQKHVGQSRMIPQRRLVSRFGATEKTSAVLPLRAVCSRLLSYRPPTDTLLTDARCTAQISRHSANSHDQLLCVPLFHLSKAILSSRYLYQHFYCSALMMQQADCSVHKAIFSQLKTYSPQIYYDTEPKPSQWWSHNFPAAKMGQQSPDIVRCWGCNTLKRFILAVRCTQNVCIQDVNNYWLMTYSLT